MVILSLTIHFIIFTSLHPFVQVYGITDWTKAVAFPTEARCNEIDTSTLASLLQSWTGTAITSMITCLWQGFLIHIL